MIEESAADLTVEDSQLIADILYTFMVKEAPQGIASLQSLIDRTLAELQREVKKNLTFENIKVLAEQIAVPVKGFKLDQRLFAIDMETPEQT